MTKAKVKGKKAPRKPAKKAVPRQRVAAPVKPPARKRPPRARKASAGVASPAPNSPLEVVTVKPDFIAVKLRYSSGFLDDDAPDGVLPKFESLAELSRVLGIPRKTLEWHSKREGWVDARLAFQDDVSRRADDLARRRMAMVQAAHREEVHAGARLATRKVVQALQSLQLPVVDIHRCVSALRGSLEVSETAIDPSRGTPEVLGAGGTTPRWILLHTGVLPDKHQHILDVLPEDDIDV